jgi:hypothetical protein
MNHFDAHLLYIDEGAFDTAAETLFGGWDKVEEVIDDAIIPSDEEKERCLNLEREYSLTVQIDEESPFIKEIQNQHKKYLRDKAQYKFWKDQEFIGNNRAGKRLKAHEHHGRRK